MKMCAHRRKKKGTAAIMKKATHWISGLIEATKTHQQNEYVRLNGGTGKCLLRKAYGKCGETVEIKNDRNTCHFYGNTCRFLKPEKWMKQVPKQARIWFGETKQQRFTTKSILLVVWYQRPTSPKTCTHAPVGVCVRIVDCQWVYLWNFFRYQLISGSPGAFEWRIIAGAESPAAS